MEPPDARVQQALADRRAAERADGRCVEAGRELERRQAALADAEALHRVEAADVERLERVSWTRIMAALHGSEADDLEREQAERDAAAYAVAVAQAQVEAAERDAESAAAARAALGDVETEYQVALAALEVWISEHDAGRATRLRRLTDRGGMLRAERREIAEAVEAGDIARESLWRARERLNSADSWSAWDTFMGGGMFVSAIKHDRLDEVSDLLVRTDRALERFGQELGDLQLRGLPAVTVGSLERSFDIFFDNIFSDMSVRRRIKDTALTLATASAAVEETMHDLARRGIDVESDLEACATERERVLTG